MIVVTSITNGYDQISDDHYYDSDVQYVCYTDGSIEKKGPWEFREIPIEHECPLRRALYAKIRFDKLFPIGADVVWIDACYVMTKEWVQKSKGMFPRTMMRHPKKFTYYEEIIEGYISAFNSAEDVIKITQTAKDMGYKFRKYSSPVCACRWETVVDSPFYEMWWEFSQISTRCDMIGFDLAKQFSDLKWNVVEDWMSVGIDFINTKARKKLHPQNGDMDQWKNRNDMLQQLYKITKLHPKLYYNFWNREDKLVEWVNKNILNPDLPRS